MSSPQPLISPQLVAGAGLMYPPVSAARCYLPPPHVADPASVFGPGSLYGLGGGVGGGGYPGRGDLYPGVHPGYYPLDLERREQPQKPPYR